MRTVNFHWSARELEEFIHRISILIIIILKLHLASCRLSCIRRLAIINWLVTQRFIIKSKIELFIGVFAFSCFRSTSSYFWEAFGVWTNLLTTFGLAKFIVISLHTYSCFLLWLSLNMLTAGLDNKCLSTYSHRILSISLDFSTDKLLLLRNFSLSSNRGIFFLYLLFFLNNLIIIFVTRVVVFFFLNLVCAIEWGILLKVLYNRGIHKNTKLSIIKLIVTSCIIVKTLKLIIHSFRFYNDWITLNLKLLVEFFRLIVFVNLFFFLWIIFILAQVFKLS